jgi:hypothetical protein
MELVEFLALRLQFCALCGSSVCLSVCDLVPVCKLLDQFFKIINGFKL